MTDTSIEWCRRPGTRAKTWNPTNGCKEISPGCLNCYAKVFASRFSRPGLRYEGLVERAGKGKLPMWTGALRFEEHMLAAPLSWREPCTVFVNSMSDLFMFPREQVAAVFGVAALAQQHTYIFLTKRHEELVAFNAWMRGVDYEVTDPRDGRRWDRRALMCWDLACKASPRLASSAWNTEMYQRAHLIPWPLPNVWLGVTCENRKHGLPRIDALRGVDAAVRLVSFEPLLEDLGDVDLTDIDWSIVGCESGPHAREFDAAWARSLLARSRAAGAAFFLKQARGTGDPEPAPSYEDDWDRAHRLAGITAGDGSKSKPGGVIGAPFMDGEQYLEYPSPRAA
jgi:protein gp37